MATVETVVAVEKVEVEDGVTEETTKVVVVEDPHNVPKKLDIKENPLLATILFGCETFKSLSAKKVLPLDYLSRAKAVVILRDGKAGFVGTVTHGHGLLTVKKPNHPMGWSAPIPLKLSGWSVGASMGFSERHTVVTLESEEEIVAFLENKKTGKTSLECGVQITNAVDKFSVANSNLVHSVTDGAFYHRSFSTAKGLMLDASFANVEIEIDHKEIAAIYGEGITAKQILEGEVPVPEQVAILFTCLAEIEAIVA